MYNSWEDIFKRWIDTLSASPELVFFFLLAWACGTVISSYILEKDTKLQNNFAMGLVAAGIMLLVYHALAYRRILYTLEDLQLSGIPSVLILASIIFVVTMWRNFRQ